MLCEQSFVILSLRWILAQSRNAKLFLHRLVDENTYVHKAEDKADATPMAILGPFYRDDAPIKQNGESIIVNADDGQVTYMHGRVLDCVTKEPIKNALVQIWQASTNGLYDQQDPKQMTGNLRGQFRSDDNGDYALYCLRPTPYPIEPNCECSALRVIWSYTPTNYRIAPAANLLDLMDKHHYRPAHIHAYVSVSANV